MNETVVMKMMKEEVDRPSKLFNLTSLNPPYPEFMRRDARFHADVQNSTQKIRFSRHTWTIASESEVRKTIVHELCHIINHLVYHGIGHEKHGKE